MRALTLRRLANALRLGSFGLPEDIVSLASLCGWTGRIHLLPSWDSTVFYDWSPALPAWSAVPNLMTVGPHEGGYEG
jgi:hypothetical protein